MNFYRPKHFILQELLDPDTWTALGDRGWSVLDPRIVIAADALRDHFGACIINNWKDGGDLKYCGFRPANSPVGAAYSQHRFGRALDLHFNTDADDVRAYVLAHSDLFPTITGMETGIPWNHIDCRDHGGNQIMLFKP